VNSPADGADDEIIAELRARPSDVHMAEYLSTPNPIPPGAAHRDGIELATVTTLHLGGPCADVIIADTEEVLVSEVAKSDDTATDLLIVAGGSNVVVADEGWPGRLVLVRTNGIEIEGDSVTVAAGEPWDEFVARMISEGRSGIEALSGIPGSVGATPIQNVGAYGQEVAQTISAVLVWDRRNHEQRWLTAEQCDFTYRDSLFKRQPDHFVVLQVRFELPQSSVSEPIRYGELAHALGVAVGDRAAVADVRAAVLALRRNKGMVVDPADRDSWSAGSFFTNPVLSVEAIAQLPADAPRYPVDSNHVKTSAAWLIERSGIGRGFALSADSEASVSTKHTLALTNRGSATTTELLELARFIRQRVFDHFGVWLQPEPVLVGCQL
jgi:UDP-N-acetylmuramate dehydrogenase